MRADFPLSLLDAPIQGLAPATALVIGDHEWGSLALASVLAGGGWASRQVSAGDAAGVLLATGEPAVAFFLVRLGERARSHDTIELCSNLRARELLSPAVPAIFVTFDAPRREDLLRAYAAGAWEVCQLPLDGQLLLARLERWLGAQRAAERARHARLIDEETGLYTTRGLLHRATELVAESRRSARPLACLALAVDARPLAPLAGAPVSAAGGATGGFGGTGEPTSAAATEGTAIARLDRTWLLGRLLSRVRTRGGRCSDVFGRTGREEFAVLAPATTAEEALRMAERLGLLLREQWERLPKEMAAGDVDAGRGGAAESLLAVASPPCLRWAVAVLGEAATAQGAAARLLTRASAGLARPAGAPICVSVH